MQEVDFNYELIIGEDCSTDRRRQKVEEYQRKYPDKILLLLPDRNMGQRHRRGPLPAVRSYPLEPHPPSQAHDLYQRGKRLHSWNAGHLTRRLYRHRAPELA